MSSTYHGMPGVYNPTAPPTLYPGQGSALAVDANGRLINGASPLAYIFATDGTYNYYASALPGTSPSAASWKVMRVLIADGVTTTWANGNANYTNVGTATGLSSLSYS